LTNYVITGETVIFYLLSLALLLRGWRGGAFPRFPLFYTYISYMVVTGIVTLSMYAGRSPIYRQVVWARLLTGLVAEFIVLLEISDHLFSRFPAVRRLGRLLTAFICAVFFFAYVLPALLEAQTSRHLILEFLKRTSLTKVVVILLLLAACRFFRLPMERDVVGILLGFSVFLSANVVNSTLGQEFSPEVIERMFGIIGPVSYTLGMAIWAIALWNPVPAPATQAASASADTHVGLDLRLDRLNTTLDRLRRP
jgi:hypothetical protein